MFSSKQTQKFDYFICYHLESGWHVTRLNQGLSLGRGKILGTRLICLCCCCKIITLECRTIVISHYKISSTKGIKVLNTVKNNRAMLKHRKYCLIFLKTYTNEH